MKDIQKQQDDRNITVDEVGVSGIRYPINVKDRLHGLQKTVSDITMSVELLPEFKGTHMSRFLEILNEVRGEITMANIPLILNEMREKLESPKSFMEMKFPYFIEKESPVSKAKSMFSIDVMFSGYSSEKYGNSFILGLKVPVTTLCPCSKEISEYGAHNQRSYVTLFISSETFLWLEELVKIIEESSSSAIYPLLKRPDEKYVTEKAYENPSFAEDLVRNVTLKLSSLKGINWFRVKTLHLESIHTHNAFAVVTKSFDVSDALSRHIKMISEM